MALFGYAEFIAITVFFILLFVGVVFISAGLFVLRNRLLSKWKAAKFHIISSVFC